MLKSKKGQSTVEYVILVSAVIAGLIVFLNTPASPFRTALDETLTDASDGMSDMSGRLRDSRPLSP